MSPKPIVFIPGFPASELWRKSPRRMLFPPGLDDIATTKKRERLIQELTDVESDRIVAGQPIRRVMMIAKQAESLYDILRTRFGYTIEGGDNFRAVGWDWRRAVDDDFVHDQIRKSIKDLTSASGQKPVVVVHSTGGLVFRALIENDPSVAKSIESILALGVPWIGTLKSLAYLTKGEKMGFLTAKLSAAQTRTIIRSSQAAYDLCPPNPDNTNFTTPNGEEFVLVQDGKGTPIGSMVKPAWLAGADLTRAAAAHTRLGERSWSIATDRKIVNVAGWGLATDTLCTIDGKSVEFQSTTEGDGTVPYVSSSWIRGEKVRTLSVPIGVTVIDQIPDPHSQLWNNSAVDQILREILLDEDPAELVYAAVDNDSSRDSRREIIVRVVASQPDGLPLPDARVTVRLTKGNSFSRRFGNRTRLELPFKRISGLAPNFGSRHFRFRVDVKWSGGEKELPLMFRI